MADPLVSTHPLVQVKLTQLRRVETEPREFRRLVRELAWLLAYEALADVALADTQITTPMAPVTGKVVAERIGLVPILRAGLGMVDGLTTLLPEAPVWHLGLYRDHATLQPMEYYRKLPETPTADICLILDPMLATGGSAVAAVNILKRWGVQRIKFLGLIASPQGVDHLRTSHPDVPIHVAAVDPILLENGYIVPGLGDAGDRQFGTA